MGKRKTRQPPEAADARHGRLMDGMFVAMRDRAMSVLGRTDVTIGDGSAQLIVGLPIPSLALRYLFQMDVFPLERFWQLAGHEGSAKSALMVEIMRWHMLYGGGGALAEVEGKDSAPMRNSLLGYDPAFMDRMLVAYADSCEDWQRFLTTSMTVNKIYMDEPGGIGRTIPMCYGVDSLTAADVQSEIDKTMADGAAKASYPLMAKSIAVYMRRNRNLLRGYPLSVVATNHLKEGKDENGLPIKNIPGGKAMPFMATFMIEMKRTKDIDLANYGGIRVKMSMSKNSLGPSRKFIHAELLWWRELLQDGNTRQRCQWDWHGASIEMLLAFDNMSGKKTLFKDLMQIVDLHQPRVGFVWSRVLGIPKDEPVVWRTAGQMLESRPELLQALYPLLGVNRYTAFQPGLDYQQMMDQQQSERVAAAVSVNADAGPLPVLPEAYRAETAKSSVAAGEAEAPLEEEEPAE